MCSQRLVASVEGEGQVDGEAVRIPPSALIGAFLCSFPAADFSGFGQYGAATI